MSKPTTVTVRALKTFRGIEGLVRRGDVFTVSPERAAALERVKSVEKYSDKMAAAPGNKMRPGPENKGRHDPAGMVAQNAGGLVTFGPEGGRLEEIGQEADEGNAQGGEQFAPIGSPTGEAGTLSSSPPGQAQRKPRSSSSKPAGGQERPKRGRRQPS